MEKRATGDSENQPVVVCLIEYNPLATAYLQQILRARPALQVLTQEDVLKRRPRSVRPEVSVFLVDRGTLPEPLSKQLRILRFRYPQAKTILLGQTVGPEELSRLLFLGVQGFIPYDRVAEHLGTAIDAVLEGHLWVPARVRDQHLHYAAHLAELKAMGPDCLTPGEWRVMELLRRQLSTKEISSILGVSDSTVKFHLANIFSKLGVHDRQAAIDLMISEAWSDPALEKSK